MPAEVDFKSLLRSLLGAACVLSDEQCRLLESHFAVLMKWNRKMNLTSVRDPSEVVQRHYCESVFLACHLPEDGLSVVDVGSGAGFPGVGVAVMRPRASVVLVESNQKKAVFLQESTREIPNVRVVAERAERVSERFDWLVSRAVAWRELPRLADQVALLASEPGPEYPWSRRIKLPWGDRRVLLLGTVPRETLC